MVKHQTRRALLPTAAITPKLIRSVLLLVWTALFYFIPSVQATYGLQMIDEKPLLFYFSEDQTPKAKELISVSRSMIDFLGSFGLNMTTTVHIILDDELDHPRPRTYLLPHREIRLPLRAPGVLEEGYLQPDPWRYFLFKGLCIHSMYNERSGIPGALHPLFGDLMTPNRVLPEWFFDSVAFLLYEKYRNQRIATPLATGIFDTGPFPDLDIVSNHPEIWPGRYSYSIYGRPFVRWLAKRYGWDKVLAILQRHGAGIVPIEIDLEAIDIFQKTWNQLWVQFKREHPRPEKSATGEFIVGYWDAPFIYWNDTGVHPGELRNRERSRYGFMDQKHRLWLSGYDGRGVSRVTVHGRDDTDTIPRKHVWDPGPGGVAVTRRGHRPCLIWGSGANPTHFFDKTTETIVDAPEDVIQLSGPVSDGNGRVAVAGNKTGNWDIWLYDGQWHQITTSPSIEMDPWIENDTLIFSSNISGRFQIHNYDMSQITQSETQAVLPRHHAFAQLTGGGWQINSIPTEKLVALPERLPGVTVVESPALIPAGAPAGKPYNPFKSLWPNYIAPDMFIDTDDFQIGLSTRALDVSGRYGWDTGIRYSTEDQDYSWRLGGHANSLEARATRYPFSYSTERLKWVDEVRHEIRLGWSPQFIRKLEISANWRHYEPTDTRLEPDEEWWGALSYHFFSDRWELNTNIDLFTDDSQSVYGLIARRFGQRIHTVAKLYAGKTWGDPVTGHNTYRIGGNYGEGFFTHRPSRLFPLRGFDANILDAGHAATASLETFWPVAELQAGYKTLPLFLRNIRIGTFVDGGFAADEYSDDELLVGAGFELITGMEFAWGVLADFRIGLAWPLCSPDDIEDNGPVVLVQIGRPL